MSGWHVHSRVFDLDVGEATPALCHAVEVGPKDGPAIVMLHGIAVSSWAWRKNLEPLAKQGFRAIALCHKGHGWSGRGAGAQDLTGLSRFVLAAMDHLGVDEATLVGNSLGGGVALWTALHAPERVARLVLINPASHTAQLPWALFKMIAAMSPVVKPFFVPSLLRIPLAGIAYRNLPIDRDYMAGFWAPFEQRGSLKTLLATAKALPEAIAELDRRLGEIRHEVVVIWGEKDALLPVSGAWRLVRRLPNARLVLVPEAGHCPHEESPERVNRIIAEAARGRDDGAARARAAGDDEPREG